MRPIKFRAWDKEDELMIDRFWLSSEGDLYETPVTVYDTPHLEIERNDDLVVMQYTGLKDKNDVEIYEGDILLGYSVYPEFDLFESKLLGEVYYSSRGTWDCYSYILGGFNDQVEVIGNIYENPELLEREAE